MYELAELLVPICMFTFIFLIVVFALVCSVKKKKIDAALRLEEMKRGYEPGTYSRARRTHSSAKKSQVNSKTMERQELEKGIDDLMKRINNIETIMKGEKDGN